ncbi:hypothetical protein [Ruegeria sp. Alg231-54]|uniref:hypothetical protein n=1 Tax=Ruegeria sp. Alg231-54 TaxID=1922221 RepID=UPI00131F0814|nr:hypothetical protein [Ruegeria sp. Alg231-54]
MEQSALQEQIRLELRRPRFLTPVTLFSPIQVRLKPPGTVPGGLLQKNIGSGDIEIKASNTIRTKGTQAEGILVQATNASTVNKISVSSASGILETGSDSSRIEIENGGAGSVEIETTREILTCGAEANGIKVSNSDRSDTAIRGSITTEGSNASSVRVAGSTFNTFTVSFTETTVQGGTGESSAVRFSSDSGTGNVLEMSGEVVLSSQCGSGVFGGAGNTLTNDGVLSPGGRESIATTTVTDQLVQGESSSFAADLDLDTGAADRLNVTETATLDGAVGVNVPSGSGCTQQFTILSAAGGTTNEGVTLNG